MKKLFTTPIFVMLTANLFAAFTETENTFDSIGGYDIVGTGSVSELSSDTYNWIRLSGTLNFDSDASLTLTSTTTKLGTTGFYDFVVLNSSGAILNFTGSGTMSMPTLSTSQNTELGLNSYNGPLTINVAKGAGGLITGKVCGQTKALTLNLHKENAIVNREGGAFVLSVVNSAALNMSADQKLASDFRNGAILNLNITDNANLFVDVNRIFSSGTSASIKIQDNTLENGAILFAKDRINSAYDTETGYVVIQRFTSIQTLKIQDSDGKALTSLNWSEVTIDGTDYYKLTGMAVPEPAEWAAIFGATALVLAFRRKGK